MNFVATDIAGVMLIEPRVFGDDRGYFMETWHAAHFAAAGIDATFVQDNHSRSAKGVLRGLHYQAPRPQGKLIRVTAGTVFDVVVDLRRSSASFGRCFGAELSEANRRMLWAPPGTAHGFLTLSRSADLIYKCTDFYAPADEQAIAWNDADLAIPWPLDGAAPVLSARDASAGSFAGARLYP
ncbi:MAG TPA: dTDP-4-dehydrorhamnose 3,5-epimerase [Caulobacteraceae bacterium]